jgi:KDO2-lipid IV(A) lauroyltransferase
MGILIVPMLWILAWFIYLLPSPLRLGLGVALGELLRILRFRAKVVQGNLDIARKAQIFSEKVTLGQVRREFYRHFGKLIIEALILFGPFKRFCLRTCEIRGFENWQRAHDLGNGVIFLSSHVGNWEIMAASPVLQENVDVLLVTKHLKPEWFHRAIESSRQRCGVKATYEPKTFGDVLTHLKNKGSVGIVLDQYAGPPVGMRVPFFGVPVGTHTLVALLAKRTGAPVVPAVSYRLSNGQYVLEMRPAVPWISGESLKQELGLNTAAYAKILEGDVRQHPSQWLWTHRRFKGNLGPLTEQEWKKGRSR